MTFILPESDPEVIELAQKAYRLAWEHEQRVDEAWEARRSEWEKEDEFSRIRVARENALFLAERLRSEARELLLCAVLGGARAPFPRDPFDVPFFEKVKDRKFTRILKVVDEARLKVEGLVNGKSKR
jgi:hypothetical protein